MIVQEAWLFVDDYVPRWQVQGTSDNKNSYVQPLLSLAMMVIRGIHKVISVRV